jgi:hypothetical protein
MAVFMAWINCSRNLWSPFVHSGGFKTTPEAGKPQTGVEKQSAGNNHLIIACLAESAGRNVPGFAHCAFASKIMHISDFSSPVPIFFVVCPPGLV